MHKLMSKIYNRLNLVFRPSREGFRNLLRFGYVYAPREGADLKYTNG